MMRQRAWAEAHKTVTAEQAPGRAETETGCPLLYRLIWLFWLGALLGCVVETVWRFLRTGQYECRAGLVFGPFNPVYGTGACLFYLAARGMQETQRGKLFLYGMLAGTGVEYFLSLAQETLFGTVSWDYSGVPLNLGGRVCLLYSVFWGLLALAWMQWVQPLFEKAISVLPPRTGRVLAWCIVLFFVINITVSVLAVARWGMRMEGVPANSLLQLWADSRFPDTRMEYLYPSMAFVA